MYSDSLLRASKFSGVISPGTLAAQVLAEAIHRGVTTARIPEEEFLANIAGK